MVLSWVYVKYYICMCGFFKVLSFNFNCDVLRVFDKKPAPVDMSKLLSFGYAEDDKQTGNTDVSSKSHNLSSNLPSCYKSFSLFLFNYAIKIHL